MTYIYRSSTAEKRVREWCEVQYDDWSHPHQRKTLSTGLGESHLTIVGDGPTTVLFVPGTNFCAASCLEEIGYLSAHFKVVAVDVPGQPGLSSAHRPKRQRFDALGRWLDEVVDQLESLVTVVGHSMGSSIALAARSRHITGRVLINPSGLTRLKVPLPLLATTLSWLIRSTESNSAKLLTRMSTSRRPPSVTQTKWMTLVGRTTRSSLAPPPFSDAHLSELNDTALALASGRHDAVLPPAPMSRRSQKMWGQETVALNSGHLMNMDTLKYIVNAVKLMNH